jgi:hypothetical protein
MTYLMILIDEIIVDNVNVKFYEGMDCDLLLNHAKDGSDGFIFCFIENWVNEVKSYNRQRKLSSVVDNVDYEEFEWEEINNNFISVYQTEGMGIIEVYQTIKQKVIRKQFEHKKWMPIGGMTRGAWNVGIRKIDD